MEQRDEPDVYYATLEEQFLARDGVDLRRSVHGAGLAVDGRIFGFLEEDSLVAKVGSGVVARATASGEGAVYAPGSRPRRSWVAVPFDEGDVPRWERYLELAYGLARGLGR